MLRGTPRRPAVRGPSPPAGAARFAPKARPGARHELQPAAGAPREPLAAPATALPGEPRPREPGHQCRDTPAGAGPGPSRPLGQAAPPAPSGSRPSRAARAAGTRLELGLALTGQGEALTLFWPLLHAPRAPCLPLLNQGRGERHPPWHPVPPCWPSTPGPDAEQRPPAGPRVLPGAGPAS